MTHLTKIQGDPRRVSKHTSGCCAFTLIEILVSIAIIAVLLALVIPIAARTIGSARGFKCQMSQRSSAYDFTVFADDVYHGDRGRDERRKTSFRLETFVASQYCLEEFWCWPGETRREMPDANASDPLRCPEVKGTVVLRSNSACDAQGVTPWPNVSYGFNMRLRYAERTAPGPGPAFVGVYMRSSILGESNVPLLWDVDGQVAMSQGHSPFYSAPSLGSPLLYANDQYWFPGKRHNGGLNVGFVDGHVEATRAPLAQPSWRWDFTPDH
ncbi:MAG: prepilin-type N-terminal cleavage/methylation domain-containing protein [Pyrinomonadaceae bacterium]|nr:prepilin-type N-terminal cleavage/methylation domain-containing protein [Phycisphaerales bacterium]